MEREGIGFTEVDIEREPGTAEFVMSVNGGNLTVPTLLFPDGSAATNPSIARSATASPDAGLRGDVLLRPPSRTRSAQARRSGSVDSARRTSAR